MQGDNTDCIPELLLAEDVEEIDAAQAHKNYGIESMFKVRCEVLDIDREASG